MEAAKYMSALSERSPNVLEPWMEAIFRSLTDENSTVRLIVIQCLLSLTLNDMLLVKSYVAQVVKCLNDENNTVSELAKLFFTSLATRDQKLYNALPDIISRLTDPSSRTDPDQDKSADEAFKFQIEYLLQYIEKDKHLDALFEKLTSRLIRAVDDRQILELSFCLSQIKSITNKGTKAFLLLASENKDEITKVLGFKLCYDSYKRLFKDEFSKEALEKINSFREKFEQEDRANKLQASKSKSRRKKK